MPSSTPLTYNFACPLFFAVAATLILALTNYSNIIKPDIRTVPRRPPSIMLDESSTPRSPPPEDIPVIIENYDRLGDKVYEFKQLERPLARIHRL